MYITTERGLDLRIGRGLYRFHLGIYGLRSFLIRVPFIGKAWSYGPGHSGCIGWAEVKREGLYADD